MTKLECAGFDELLLEAWERCTDDTDLRASAAYGCVRKWLARLTSDGNHGPGELARLRRLVHALRASADGLMSLDDLLRPPDDCDTEAAAVKAGVATVDGGGEECRAMDECAPKSAAAAAPPPKCNEKLVAALETSGCSVRDMREFFKYVAAHTCDGGTVLMRVTSAVLNEFRAFVDTVFGNRVAQIGMVLAREQSIVRDAYSALECRALNRAQLALLHVRDVLPTFDWNRYATQRGYMAAMVAASGVDPSTCVVPGETESDDARAKRLLYQLNWLRSEVERAECENRGLYAQHVAVDAQLAAINQDIADAQCLMAGRRERLACELKGLREKSAGQVRVMDDLMETIQISIHRANSAESVVGADVCAP